MNIKFSVVTVCYNNLIGLKKTIKSVRSQDYKYIEHIIVDGYSSDGTREFLERTDGDEVWISESDDGIYDAMNKGMTLSKGDFIIMLNSGDCFVEHDCLTNVSQYISKYKDYNSFYFGRVLLRSNNKTVLYPKIDINSSNINKWLKRSLPNHQGIFFPKQYCLKEFYSTKYRIVADSEYKLRAINNLDYIFMDLIVSEFEIGGLSSSYSSLKLSIAIARESFMLHLNYEGLIYATNKFLVHLIKFCLIKFRIRKV